MEQFNDTINLGDNVVKKLKSIYDPEIPVDIYELGLIYDVMINEDNEVKILMTLTSYSRNSVTPSLICFHLCSTCAHLWDYTLRVRGCTQLLENPCWLESGMPLHCQHSGLSGCRRYAEG